VTALTRRPQLTFLALALTIGVVAPLMAAKHPRVAPAALFDMTVTVTALYYWLVVRPGLRPKASLIFVALLGLLRASFAFPALVRGRSLIAAAIELAVVGALVGVPSLRGAIPVPGIQRVLAAELSVLYYAFAFRARPDVPAGARPFTLHERSGIGDLLMALAPFSLLEIVPVHLLAAHWKVKLAWALTGVGLYGGVWAFALGRSFALRPGFVTGAEIVVRFGLLFSLRIPKDCVATVQREPIAGAVRVARNAAPNLYLGFTRPLEAERMFGFTKRVGAVALCLDDPAALS